MTAGSLDVSVDWDDTPGADDYLVQWRQRGAGNTLNEGLSPTASSVTITVADYGLWVVRVRACNAAGCSTPRAIGFETRAAAQPPGAPQALEIDLPEDGSLDVSATWDATEGATTYRLSWQPADSDQPGTDGQAGGAVGASALAGRSAGSQPSGSSLQGDSLQTASASATATVGAQGRWEFSLSACNNAGCSTPTVRTVDVRSRVTIDYDLDDDGLIEIRGDDDDVNGDNNVDMARRLNLIRVDLDGDGIVYGPGRIYYRSAFIDAAAGMGCPATGCIGYELTDDIDLNIFEFNSGTGWTPIAYTTELARCSRSYDAVFEGNGHTISNLMISRTVALGRASNGDCLGLFANLGSNAVVRNLGVTDATITTRLVTRNTADHVGVLAGHSEGLVVAAYSTGKVTCGDAVGNTDWGCQWVGGLVGRLHNGTIRRSHSSVDVSQIPGGPRNNKAGGLVGSISGTTAKVEASYATGDVSGGDRLGGLVGESSGTVTASYAIGKVNGTGEHVGGLVGINHIIRYEAPVHGTVTASYYNSDTSGQSDTGKGAGKTAIELLSPTGYADIYADWNLDFDGDGNGDDPWQFGDSRQYPGLLDGQGVVHRPTFVVQQPTLVDYDNDDDGLIEIDSPAKLNAFQWDPDGDGVPGSPGVGSPAPDAETTAGYDAAFPDAMAGMGCPGTGCKGYELVADLTLTTATGPAVNPDRATWTPLAFEAFSRAATDPLVILEGNGHSISGLKINSTGEEYVGLFQQLTGHEIRNLTIIDPRIETELTAPGTAYAGALAGKCSDCVIDGVYISGGSVLATGSNPSSSFHIGGMVARAERGRIADSYSTAVVARKANADDSVDEVHAGGLVGSTHGAVSIVNSYASGIVMFSGGDSNESNGVYLGGLVGSLGADGAVTASYAGSMVTFIGTVKASGEAAIGGLIGSIDGSQVSASYALGDVTAEATLSGTGTSKATEHAGGLIGRAASTAGTSVTDSFYNSHEAGQSDTGKGEGKTTTELISPTGYSGIFSGWDVDLDNADSDDNLSTGGDNPWRFGTAQQYPGLVFDGEVHRPQVPRLACTKGPGSDWRNPDGPCGVGPTDRPENHKDYTTMTDEEKTNPPDPLNVRIVDSSDFDNDCPAGAASCHISWQRPFGITGGFSYRIYWFADLNRTSTCTTRSILVDQLSRDGQATTVSPSAVSTGTPSNLPAGCTVKRWVAAVSIATDDAAGGKASGSTLAFRDP